MSYNDISLRQPTKEELESLEQEDNVRYYTIYFYKCFKCGNEFRSNLSLEKAICPKTPKIHKRNPGAIVYTGKELKPIFQAVLNW